MVVDTLGLVAKSGITLLLVSRPSALPSALPHLPPALVFSIGQLALSAVTLMGYGAYGLLLLHQTVRMQRTQLGRGFCVRVIHPAFWLNFHVCGMSARAQ